MAAQYTFHVADLRMVAGRCQAYHDPPAYLAAWRWWLRNGKHEVAVAQMTPRHFSMTIGYWIKMAQPAFTRAG